MNIPIITLYNALKTFINDVKTDLTANQQTPTQSWLYREFGSLSLEGYDFYENLKHNIQLVNDTRQLELRLMYDPSRANLPTMHLIYPSENTRSGSNFIGTGDLGTDENGYSYKSRSFVGDYEIIITGVNSVQVVSLYEFLDALLIASADKLAVMFDVFHFNGKQLMFDSESYNLPIFYRSVGVSLQVNKIVSKLAPEQFFTDIRFEGEYYTGSQEPSDSIVAATISNSLDKSEFNVNDSVTFTCEISGFSGYKGIQWYKDEFVIGSGEEITFGLPQIESFELKCIVETNMGYLPFVESNILSINVL